MFACLYSSSVPLAALIKLAEDFTPRFEVLGPLVMLDAGGLSRLFGTPREIGDHLRRAAAGPVRIAIAPTQTAAALMALGRPGLVVLELAEVREALGELPVTLLGEFERVRLQGDAVSPRRLAVPPARVAAPVPPSVGAMADVLPYFHSSLARTSDAAAQPHREAGDKYVDTVAPVEAITQPAPSGGGWTHPRDAHAAAHTRRPRRPVTAPRDVEHAYALPEAHPPRRVPSQTPSGHMSGRVPQRGVPPRDPAIRARHAAIEDVLDTLRRWGVRTLGQLAALPAGEVYERLGARGILWQRLARGDESTPLVPWIPEDPFEDALDLDWPIEGLEPLSFVLGRLLEPLADRLERADRGAAILHTHLRLVDRTVHARTLQLPSPMRDPKTLRTLVLLDLETHPPSAGIDQVRVLIEPTPARVTQWALFERAQPSPEQVSTLLARLAALMGESHVGSPQLVDTWKPGAFEMTPFAPGSSGPTAHDSHGGAQEVPGTSAVSPALARQGTSRAQSRTGAQRHAQAQSRSYVSPQPPATSESNAPGLEAQTRPEASSHLEAQTRVEASNRVEAQSGPGVALRRFRLPVPARVQMEDGRPVRILTDRRGVTGGAVVQAAGPWRTSGAWWNDAQPGRAWDRDEWDVALADGTIYRIYVERDVGQWFLEGCVD